MIEEIALAELTAEKRRLQAELKDLQEALDAKEEAIMARWAAEGTTQVKVKTVNGPYVLYCSTRVFSKMEFLDIEKVTNEFPNLMTINHAKTGSLLTELLATGNEGALAQLARAGITPNEVTRINCKKG